MHGIFGDVLFLHLTGTHVVPVYEEFALTHAISRNDNGINHVEPIYKGFALPPALTAMPLMYEGFTLLQSNFSDSQRCHLRRAKSAFTLERLITTQA